jgi:SAM-dependent methyltransferase
MSPWTASGQVDYYDSDYPAHDARDEDVDDFVRQQGLTTDIARYEALLSRDSMRVIECCCGTGRVAIPLARAGAMVYAVDASPEMLRQLEVKISAEVPEVAGRIVGVQQDISDMALPHRDADVAIFAFNSLLCIDSLEKQSAALNAVREHLRPGGLLVLDVANPRAVQTYADGVPRPLPPRRNVRTGNIYTRFALVGPVDSDQRQRLYGWYDEIDEHGIVRRTSYDMSWRLIHRFELELLLRLCGFRDITVEGGHGHQPFTESSPRMFVTATAA